MKSILVILLAVSLFAVYAEAKPAPEDDYKELIETASKTFAKLKEAMVKLRAKVRKELKEYFDKDGLGDKIKAVLEILGKRFADRIEKAVDKMN